MSLIYEVLQYIFAIGRSDITDVIMNTAGGIVVLVCATFGSAAVSGLLLAIFYAN